MTALRLLQPDAATPQHRFSFFRAPISNVMPHNTVGLRQICNAIQGDYYRAATEELRRLRRSQHEGHATQRDVQRYKARHFDYATFSGIFTRRRDDALLTHSGLLCLDFDHIDQWRGEGVLQGVYGLRYALMHDASIDTALIFRSPGGDGLKWVIYIDPEQGTHAQWFDAVAFYVSRTYGVEVDASGRDVSRACYLPWDPDALYFTPLTPLTPQKH